MVFNGTVFKFRELYIKSRMHNTTISPILKGLLKLIGERFPYLESRDILLLLLHTTEEEEIKNRISRGFVHAVVYCAKETGIPLPYKFIKKEEGIFSDELEMDLNELSELGYIKFNAEIKLTNKGKERADHILKTLVYEAEKKEIRDTILPIKQLFSG